MNFRRTKSRLDMVQDAMQQRPFKVNLSLLTDEELDIAIELLKADKELVLIPISKAIAQGFTVPDNPEETETELLKFFLQQTKNNKK